MSEALPVGSGRASLCDAGGDSGSLRESLRGGEFPDEDANVDAERGCAEGDDERAGRDDTEREREDRQREEEGGGGAHGYNVTLRSSSAQPLRGSSSCEDSARCCGQRRLCAQSQLMRRVKACLLR